MITALKEPKLKKPLSELATQLFAVFYIFHAYYSSIRGVRIGDIIMLISAALFALLFNKKSFRFHEVYIALSKLLCVFILITLVDALIYKYVDMVGIAFRTIRWTFYIGVACIVSECVDINKLYRYLVAIGLISAIVIIVQYLVYAIFKYPIGLNIGAEQYGYAVEKLRLDETSYRKIYRFCAFYAEPSHFGYFESLVLAMIFFWHDKPNLKQIIVGVIIITGMLMSTSTYALALLAVLVIAYLAQFIKKKYAEKKHDMRKVIAILAGILILLVIAFLLVKDTAIVSYTLSKLGKIGSMSRTQYIWDNSKMDFPLAVKILGCGVGNEEYFVRQMFDTKLPYLNSLSIGFLYCGFTGLALMAWFFIRAIRVTGGRGRIILVLLLVMSLFSAAFYSSTVSLFLTAAVLGDRGFGEKNAAADAEECI